MTYASLFQTKSSFHEMNSEGDATPFRGQPTSHLANDSGDDLRRLQDAIKRAQAGRSVGTSPSGKGEIGRTDGRADVSSENRMKPSLRIQHLVPKIPATALTSVFHALQEWEGYVTAIHKDAVQARLVDITAHDSKAQETARIPLMEISDEDLQQMRVGSVFRWVIGYERSHSGKKRVSQIVFRNLPQLTEKEIQDGHAWADEVIASLKL